jgi:hypothetical protein
MNQQPVADTRDSQAHRLVGRLPVQFGGDLIPVSELPGTDALDPISRLQTGACRGRVGRDFSDDGRQQALLGHDADFAEHAGLVDRAIKLVQRQGELAGSSIAPLDVEACRLPDKR